MSLKDFAEYIIFSVNFIRKLDYAKYVLTFLGEKLGYTIVCTTFSMIVRM